MSDEAHPPDRYNVAMARLGAVATFARSRGRRDWRALVLLTLAVAIAAGLVMTAAIGARRAGSAWDRFARDTRSPDVFKEVPIDEGDVALADVLTRPGVQAAGLMGFMFVVPEGRVPDGAQLPGAFVGLSPGIGTTVYRPLILSGRAADPTRADEFTINEAMARLTGLKPGDQVTLISSPTSVRQAATVVGIQAGPFDVTLNSLEPGALMTAEFGAAWFDVYIASLRLEDPSQYPELLMANVPAKHDRAALLADNFVSGREFGSEAIAALNAQRSTFTVLAIVGAVGALLATGQAVSRRVRREADQLPVLAALGLAPGGRELAIAAAPWAAAAVGIVTAPLVAFVATPLVSTGVARRLEVHRPYLVDLTVMLPGVGAGIVIVAVAAWLAARRADTQPKAAQPHPASMTLPGPAGLFGGRVASGWGTPTARTVARSHVAGVVMGLAAITGVAVWSGAARHLVSTPSRYGVTWDASIGLNEDDQFSFDPALVDAAAARLTADQSVGNVLARVVAGMYEGLGGNIEIIEIDRTSGPWWPTVITGRAPAADEEITVGFGVTGLGVGDTVELGGRTLTVVGKHVVSPLLNGSPGGSVAMSSTTAPDLSLDFPEVVLLVDLAPGATLDDLGDVAGEGLNVYGFTGSLPGEIANLGSSGGLIDLLLAACVALGFAAFANGLIVATHARRADHATLRALGAQQRTITGSVAWHGGLVAVTGIAVGIPVGLVLGRTAWHRTTRGINVVPDLWRWGSVAVVVAAVTVLAAGLIVVAIAAIPGRRPSARQPE